MAVFAQFRYIAPCRQHPDHDQRCFPMAGVLASLFQFNRSSGVLCGVVTMAYPSVGEILKYLHNADAYMIAALLAVVSFWLADRKPGRWWPALAVPVLAVAMGTYQAMLSLVVALMFVRAVQRILNGADDDRSLLCTAGRYVLLLVAGIALYYLMVHISTTVSGIPLTEYQSTNRMGHFTAAEFAGNFKGCFLDFKKAITFLSFKPGYYVNGYANYAFVILCGMLVFGCFIIKQGKTPLQCVVLTVLMLLSPLLLCSIRLANPSSVESRMTYSVLGLYLLGIVLIERLGMFYEKWKDRKTLKLLASVCAWALTFILAAAVFVWSVSINHDLYNGKREYDHLYDNCSDYLIRAESVEGYEPGLPIYVIGFPESSSRKAPLLALPKYYYAFMVRYMDVKMPYGVANEVDAAAKAIQQTEGFHALPCWPEEGCAARLGDAMVVKLGNN